MRGRLRAVALLALLLLGAGSPTASGQEPVAQPAYRTGDFWNYTVDVGPNVPLLGPDSDMSAQGHRRVEVVGTSTDGDGRPAYEAEVGWRMNMSGSFVLLGAEVGVSGRLRSNGTSLWAVDGLDTLSSTETTHLSLVVEWFGSY